MEYDFSDESAFSQQQETKSVKSIKPDLKKYSINDSIIHEAEKVYTELGRPTKKGAQRLQLLYYCVELAYNNLNMKYDEKNLRAIFNITKQEANKARKLFITYSQDHKPKREFETTEFYIEKYYKEIYTSYATLIKPTQELYRLLIKHDITLTQETPSKFSMVVISLVFGMLDIPYHKVSMTKHIELAPMTFDKIIKKTYSIFLDVLKENHDIVIKIHMYRIFSERIVEVIFENITMLIEQLSEEILNVCIDNFKLLEKNSPRMFYVDISDSKSDTTQMNNVFNKINNFYVALILYCTHMTLENTDDDSFSCSKICKSFGYDIETVENYYSMFKEYFDELITE